MGDGDWTILEVIHWHFDGCLCGGTRKAALLRMKAAIHMSIGAWCPLCLEYRWKYMEVGNGWCWRGRAQHNLSHRAWKRGYTKKTIEDAERSLTDAAQHGNVDDGSAKQTVKAGHIITYMDANPGGLAHLHVLLCQQPIQRCLNFVFKADAASHKLLSMLTSVPADSTDAMSDELKECFREALVLNLSFSYRANEVAKSS